MTTRSKRQFEIPSLARDVYLVTAQSPASGSPAARDSIAGAAAALGLDPQRLLGFIHSCCYGPDYAAADTHTDLGLAPQGYAQHGTDAGALWEGVKNVASGYSDCVLVACGTAGEHCAVMADRETAEALTPQPLRLHVSVAGPASTDAEAEALRVVRAMAGVDDGEAGAVDGDVIAHMAAMTNGLESGQTRLALVRDATITALALTA